MVGGVVVGSHPFAEGAGERGQLLSVRQYCNVSRAGGDIGFDEELNAGNGQPSRMREDESGGISLAHIAFAERAVVFRCDAGRYVSRRSDGVFRLHGPGHHQGEYGSEDVHPRTRRR